MDNWLLYALANRGKSGGGGDAASATVRFLDYDGTVVYSYTPEQFAKLKAMPANPTHKGLTAQGWDYTIESAQHYVAEYGALNIGQMYITDDGKTRIYISLKDGRLKPRLGLGINGSVVVDWGDGSETDTMTGSSAATTVYQEHTYAAEGEYVISLDVTGTASINGVNSSSSLLGKVGGDANTNRTYLASITQVELGDNIISITQYAFQYCVALTSVTIPESVTSIGGNAFWDCYALTSVTIPEGVTSIGSNAFQYCYALTSVTIPESVTSIGSGAFQYCVALTSVTIPEGVTSIGSNAFQYCYALTSVTIPESVTSIGSNAFVYCFGLGFIKFRSATPAKVSNANAWSNVPTDCIIYVPQGSLSAYTSNSKYPSSSTYTYMEY